MTHHKKPVLAYDYPEQEWGPPCSLKDGDTFVCFKCGGTSTVNWEDGMYFDYDSSGVGYYVHEKCCDRSPFVEKDIAVTEAESKPAEIAQGATTKHTNRTQQTLHILWQNPEAPKRRPANEFMWHSH